VFTGIGEFTIHKEFVSGKVAGEIASLSDPALDRIFEFCAESGLLVLIHSDIDVPFAKNQAEPVYLAQMKALLRRHPGVTTIWAHTGLGRIVQPVPHQPSVGAAERSPSHIAILRGILGDPTLDHVYFDISWSEVAKYILSSERSLKNTSEMINDYPDRFLFGTDEVAPKDREGYLKVYYEYGPLWKLLKPEARGKILKANYERLFDAARTKVRAWEAANVESASAAAAACDR